ncbi:tripartite motif-containing protein 2-like [Anneissia japonica]|uniref:tripartite motif-containing protein 2-like n=1 Tax=Anneissia japonica TaxID=1529436 RepID=UPI001425850E|nr:tripartite motif-containing protein 2-like [Anneissia japonica]XP_033111401.1 tripartite motif-containing protein 2-like [Anneissia japonica]
MAKANPFLDDLFGNSEQFPKRDSVCVCGKNEAKYYCQDCRQDLCNTCSDHHTRFPSMANHNLRTLEYMQSKALEDDLLVLQQPQLTCLIHSKPFRFFCTESKNLICEECTSTSHKPIKILEAFQQFEKTAAELKEDADDFTDNLQKGIDRVMHNDNKLEDSKAACLKAIDDTAKELINKINDNTEQMKNKLETIYKNKKKVSNMQSDELKTKINEVKNLQSRLNEILMGDKTTAMQSSNVVYEALKDKIGELPKTEPNDDGEINFNKSMSILQWKCDIGNVTEQMADRLSLKGGEDVTQGQPIVVKVNKTEDCDIDANQLKATWTHPTGETNISQVEEDDNGDPTVTGKCTSPGICKLDVRVGDKPIRQSPMSIKVNKEGLVHTIKIKEDIVSDVVLYDDDRMLVSCRTKYIFRYTQSGEYIEKVTLPEGVKVNRMYKMKNGDVAFSDYGNKCITLINTKDQVIRSIGQGQLKNPKGLHVDESVVYVADWNNICVLNIGNGQIMRRIPQERNVPDITLTKGGNVIVLYDQTNLLKFQNTKQYVLQVLDNEFKFLKNIVKADGMLKPRGVVVDADDNIIISSEDKLEVFSNDGSLIKRIDKEEDGINIPWGLSISNHPRRVVVANKGNATIQIYNY